MAETTIKQRISLEGADDIKSKLKSLGDAGEKAFKQIKDAGGAVADGGKVASLQLQTMGLHTLESENAVSKFRESLHLLHPVLDEVGVSFGGYRAYAAAASAGLGALGVVAGGALVIALEKLQDAAALTKKQLGDALNNPKLGDKLYENLSGQARKLGVDVGVLTKGFADFNEAAKVGSTIQFKGIGGKTPDLIAEQQAKGIEELYKLMRTGAGTTDAATKEFQNFNAELAKAGRLTPQIFESLSAGTRNKLADILHLPQGDLEQQKHFLELVQFTPQRLSQSLKVATPEIDKAFAAAPKGLDDSIKAIETAIKQLGEDLPGIKIAEVFDGAAKAINAADGAVKTLRGDFDELKKAAPWLNQTPAETLLGKPTITKEQAAKEEAASGGPLPIRGIRKLEELIVGPRAAEQDFPFPPAARIRGGFEQLGIPSPAAAAPAVPTGAGDKLNTAGDKLITAADKLAAPSSRTAPAVALAAAAPPAAVAPVRTEGLSLAQQGYVETSPGTYAPGQSRGGFITSFATGGPIGETGTILAHQGEGVVNAKAMRRLGRGGLQALNKGYEDGGTVDNHLGPYAKMRPSTNIEDDRPPKDAKHWQDYQPYHERKAQYENRLKWSAESGELEHQYKAMDERAAHPVDVSTWNQGGIDLSKDKRFAPLFDNLDGKADGGLITGPGTGTSDSIVTTVRPESYILNAASTEKLGVSYLQGLAEGGVPIRVSDGEYHFEPPAVKRIGLPMLERLNALKDGGARSCSRVQSIRSPAARTSPRRNSRPATPIRTRAAYSPTRASPLAARSIASAARATRRRRSIPTCRISARPGSSPSPKAARSIRSSRPASSSARVARRPCRVPSCYVLMQAAAWSATLASTPCVLSKAGVFLPIPSTPL